MSSAVAARVAREVGSKRRNVGSAAGPRGVHEARRDGRRRVAVPLYALCVSVVRCLPACSDVPSDATAALEPLACLSCHDDPALFSSAGPDAGALQAFYRANVAAGLKLVPSLVPNQPDIYVLDLPGRGRHPDGLGLEDCLRCHPVRDDGIGHGMRVYAAEDPFAAGVTCESEGCHAWIGDDVLQVGPTGFEWRGSLRPGDLLEETWNPHREMYLAGYGRDERRAGIRVMEVGPGCGGCHSLTDTSHGARPDCLTCHEWGAPDEEGGQHERHAALLDGSVLDGMASECGWCHGFDAPESEVHRAVCYNCHLSAHSPSGPGGAAQLGP